MHAIKQSRNESIWLRRQSSKPADPENLEFQNLEIPSMTQDPNAEQLSITTTPQFESDDEEDEEEDNLMTPKHLHTAHLPAGPLWWIGFLWFVVQDVAILGFLFSLLFGLGMGQLYGLFFSDDHPGEFLFVPISSALALSALLTVYHSNFLSFFRTQFLMPNSAEHIGRGFFALMEYNATISNVDRSSSNSFANARLYGFCFRCVNSFVQALRGLIQLLDVVVIGCCRKSADSFLLQRNDLDHMYFAMRSSQEGNRYYSLLKKKWGSLFAITDKAFEKCAVLSENLTNDGIDFSQFVFEDISIVLKPTMVSEKHIDWVGSPSNWPIKMVIYPDEAKANRFPSVKEGENHELRSSSELNVNKDREIPIDPSGTALEDGTLQESNGVTDVVNATRKSDCTQENKVNHEQLKRQNSAFREHILPDEALFEPPTSQTRKRRLIAINQQQVVICSFLAGKMICILQLRTK